MIYLLFFFSKENTITSETLWNTLDRYVDTLPRGTDLLTVMDSWINKPGYPLVQVTTDGRNIVIQQVAISLKTFIFYIEFPGTSCKIRRI